MIATMEFVESSTLVEQARNGSQSAYTELVRLYQANVRSFLARFLRQTEGVDDLAQEVFLAAYRQLDNYQGSASFQAWLIGIARNKALTYLRGEIRRRRRNKQMFDEAVVQWQANRLNDELTEYEEHELSIAALRGCIETLPAASKSVVELYYFQEQAAEEIAKSLNKNSGAVRMMLLRIRRALGKCVAGKLGGDYES
jgi:RNA polymerase sigma-70 factor (ECF subfamily)